MYKTILDYMPKAKALIEKAKELTYKDKIIIAIRKRYSIDDELAILRQRDTKLEEFEEYFEFVENVKKELKNNSLL